MQPRDESSCPQLHCLKTASSTSPLPLPCAYLRDHLLVPPRTETLQGTALILMAGREDVGFASALASPSLASPYQLSRKGPTRITEPNPRPHAAPPAPVCESGVPALPELRHRGRAHCPGQPVPCPPPSGAQPFPQPHPPSPDTAPCRSLGPRRCHRQQSSALPSAPCESRGRHRASPQLLCSALSPPRALSAPHTPLSPDPSPPSQPSFGPTPTSVRRPGDVTPA